MNSFRTQTVTIILIYVICFAYLCWVSHARKNFMYIVLEIFYFINFVLTKFTSILLFLFSWWKRLLCNTKVSFNCYLLSAILHLIENSYPGKSVWLKCAQDWLFASQSSFEIRRNVLCVLTSQPTRVKRVHRSNIWITSDLITISYEVISVD